MPEKILISNVSVIAMTSDHVLHNQDVEIEGRLIKSVSEAKRRVRPSGQVIDGTGKFLIPGLFDMHTHMNDKKFLPLFLMNGVTAIRELGNVDDSIFELKEQSKKDTFLGPRMFVSGKILEGDPPFWDGFEVIHSKTEAVAAVRELKQKGADFVKVYHTLPKDLYEAILDEAKKQDLKVTGHVPNDMSATEALDAGQSCIEHMSQITMNVGKVIDEGANEPGYKGWRRFTGYKVNDSVFGKLLDSLQKQDAYICPTLVVEQKISALEDYDSLASSAEAGYMDASYTEEEWNPNHKNAASNIKGVRPLWFKNYGVIFGGSKTLIKQLAQHATILAGTDTPNPFVIPGFSLHSELELLVESGLSPYEAMQAATTNAAKYLEVRDELGTIEAGKIANLVLLSENPLESISHTRTALGIVLNGQYHEVDKLKELARKPLAQ